MILAFLRLILISDITIHAFFASTLANAANFTSSKSSVTPAPLESRLFWILTKRLYSINQGFLYSGFLARDGSKLINSSVETTGGLLSAYYALSCNYRENLVYFSDYLYGQIVVYDVEDGTVQNVLRGIGGGLDAIAVDWYSGNVYWIDVYQNVIVVADKDLQFFTHLVSVNSTYSRIAVNPDQKTLFWSEESEQSAVRIYGVELTGKNRRLLYIAEKLHITALTFDVTKRRLYWIEYATRNNSEFSSLRSLDPDNPDILTTHFTFQGIRLQSLALYEGFFIFLNWYESSIVLFDKEHNRTEHLFQHSVDSYLIDVLYFSSVTQPWSDDEDQNPCLIDACEQICLAVGPGEYECACQLGYRLKPDHKTCFSKIMEDNFVLVVDDRRAKIYQISLANQSRYSVLPLVDLRRPTSPAYDYETKKLYWSDFAKEQILRSYLNGTDYEIFLDNIRTASLQIDQNSRNMYIVDASADSVVIASLDLPNITSTLHSQNIYAIEELVLSPILGKVYWTDWGQFEGLGNPAGYIESINLDGSERGVFLASLSSPTGITIDEENQIIYWTSLNHVIHWYNFKTNISGSVDVIVYGDTPNTQNRRFAEITFHGGYLYVTDVEEFSVARISANEMLNSNLKQIAAHSYGPSIFYGFRGIIVVAADTDTHSGYDVDMSICAVNRGNCPEICVPTPNNIAFCKCQLHEMYSNFDNMCHAGSIPDDNEPPSFGDTCPFWGLFHVIFTAACSDKAVFNFSVPVATDNIDPHPVVKSLIEKPPPYSLEPGHYSFKYKAYDSSNNTAVCNIRVYVARSAGCSSYIPVPSGGKADSPSCGNKSGSVVAIRCHNNSKPSFELLCYNGNWSPRDRNNFASCPVIPETSGIPAEAVGTLSTALIVMFVFLGLGGCYYLKKRHLLPVFIRGGSNREERDELIRN